MIDGHPGSRMLAVPVTSASFRGYPTTGIGCHTTLCG